VWWFRRRNKELDDSEMALKEAEKRVSETHQQGHEVYKVTESLKNITDRNHFAEQLEQIILRRRRGMAR